jgi:hypothetical protein
MAEREEAISLCRLLFHKNILETMNICTISNQRESQIEGTARRPAAVRAKS